MNWKIIINKKAKMRSLLKMLYMLPLLLVAITSNSQNLILNESFEEWNEHELPVFWMGETTNIDTNDVYPSKDAFSGEFSVNVIRSSSKAQRFSTKSIAIKKGFSYEILFHVKGNGKIRTGVYDGEKNYYNNYIESTSTWTKHIQTITAVKDTNKGEFFFSLTSDLDGLFIDSVVIFELGHEAEILSFELSNEIMPALINSTTAQVTATVSHNTSLSNLEPLISISDSASINPTGAQDFTNTVNYQVTAQDGTIKNWTVNVIAVTPEEVSIHDIQFTEDTSGNSTFENKWVKTQGIVTAIHNADFCIQQGNGKWNGLMINTIEDQNINIGDEISIYGYVSEINSITQLQNSYDLQVLETNQPIPMPVEIGITNINEEYESVLVQVNNVICQSLPNNNGDWVVSDNENELTIVNKYMDFSPMIDQKFKSISGIAFPSKEETVLAPRQIEDYIISNIESIVNSETSIYPNPASTNVYIQNPFTESNIFISNLAGQILYKTHATDKVIELDCSHLENGVYIIKLNDGVLYKLSKLIIEH